jgi:pimeloyl-ACP methyl ester carboxylesterase
MAGHSMGGWITAMTASQDAGLKGVVLISAADMGGIGTLPAARPFRTPGDRARGMAMSERRWRLGG